MTRAEISVEKRLADAMELHRSGDLAAAATVYRAVLVDDPRQADAAHLLGVVSLQRGDLGDAIARIGSAIAINPNVAAYHSNLGNAWRKSAEFARAIACYDAALALDPALLDARYGRALSSHAIGASDAAIGDYAAVLAASPGNDDARNNLGAVLLAAGRPAEALVVLDAVLARKPDAVLALRNRSQALVELGRGDEADRTFEHAASLAPGDAGILRALAGRRHQQRRLDEAIELYLRAEALEPGNLETLNDLGVAYLENGRPDLATEKLFVLVQRMPQSATAHTNFANALRALGQFDAAVELYRTALSLDPTVAETYENLGTALRDRGQLDEAAASYEAALRLKPDFAGAIGNLANLQLERGESARALTLYRKALALAPRDAVTHRNLLLAIIYDPDISPEARYAEHLEFARRHPPAGGPLPAPAIVPAAGRRLRVGYLSSDFREHPVARNLGAILAHHDHRHFEIFCYADLVVPDDNSLKLRAFADEWRNVNGMSDANVARAVRADAIDVLVCVAGRFDRNRPLVASFRPAPVHVSLFDIATSGVAGTDFLLADPVLVPRGGGERYVERVFRLPHHYVHVPISDVPEPGPPPSARAAGPVFGCLNNPAKIGDQVLDLWTRLLRETPGSRLLLKYKNLYAVPSIAGRVRAAFARAGVDPARLEIRGAVDSLAGHLAHYDAIDVALDPFPFSGSTATFEALWMGVPVVTLAGDTMARRWTAAMLASLGETGWVAADADAFVAKVQALANDVEGRARLRRELRGRVAASPLCDGKGRARQIERAYRAMFGFRTSGGRR
ncbi:MAG: tetratricopeptide repeat protein [Proteobacteria bacterium]|nr:tetratricopeptide repeat protein [Pseudomonadota bacterium]